MAKFNNEMLWKKSGNWKYGDEFIVWLKEQAKNGESVSSICKLCKANYRFIKTALKDNKIETELYKTDSRREYIYQNYEWCYEMYINRGMNHQEMADKAKCTRRVIEKWCCGRHKLTQQFRAKTKTLNKSQHDLLIGSVLGDGHIDKREGQSMFIVSHAKNQKDYLYWKYNMMKEFCNISPKEINPVIKEIKGIPCNIQKSYRMCTRIHSCFDYYKQTSINNILKQLNDFSFSIWILDDGSRSTSNWSICFARFSEDEKQMAIKYIKENINIDSYILDSDNRYLHFRANESRIIDDIILKNIPNELDIVKYKILNIKKTNYALKYFYRGEKLTDYCRSNNLNYKYIHELIMKEFSMEEAINKCKERCVTKNEI